MFQVQKLRSKPTTVIARGPTGHEGGNNNSEPGHLHPSPITLLCFQTRKVLSHNKFWTRMRYPLDRMPAMGLVDRQPCLMAGSLANRG